MPPAGQQAARATDTSGSKLPHSIFSRGCPANHISHRHRQAGAGKQLFREALVPADADGGGIGACERDAEHLQRETEMHLPLRSARNAFAQVENHVRPVRSQFVEGRRHVTHRHQPRAGQLSDLQSRRGNFHLSDTLDIVEVSLEGDVIVECDDGLHIHLATALLITRPIRSSYPMPRSRPRMMRSLLMG